MIVAMMGEEKAGDRLKSCCIDWAARRASSWAAWLLMSSVSLSLTPSSSISILTGTYSTSLQDT